jgi:ParB family chromosome partitioning protein
LSEDFGLTHQVIADRVGLDRASVTNLVRLADLDDACAMLVRSGRLSQGHAKALLSISDHKARLSLAERAIGQEWSVRELERQVQIRHQAENGARPASATAAQDPSARDANVADLEQRLSAHLGTRVRIQLGRKKGSGRLILDFYNLEQFDGIMQRGTDDPPSMLACRLSCLIDRPIPLTSEDRSDGINRSRHREALGEQG